MCVVRWSLALCSEHLKSFSLRVPEEMWGLCRNFYRQMGQVVLQQREQEGMERNRFQFLAFGWWGMFVWGFCVFVVFIYLFVCLFLFFFPWCFCFKLL